MIAYGAEGSTPKGMVTLAPGLGLTNAVIIDQHFRQRDRLGRLLSALAFNPFMIGIGLDEDTAAFIGPESLIRVMGNGAITVVDVAELKHSSMAEVRDGEPVEASQISASMYWVTVVAIVSKQDAPKPVHSVKF